MMNRYLQLVLILIVVYCNSCKEAYYPQLDEAQKILVVDGVLTDESNIITVRLSNAVPFRDQAYLPESKATLIVSDDLGREFSFIERDPGVYETKSFQYEYGRTYVLAIKTQKNKYYKSSPQKLYPKSILDSVSSVVTSKTLQTTKNGELIMKSLPGLEFSTKLDNSSTSSPYYMFSNTVLIEYTEKLVYAANPDSLPLPFYCWKKYQPNEFFNLNETGFNSSDVQAHELAFCPIDTSYFSIGKEEVWVSTRNGMILDHTYFRSLYYFGITIKKYHLNSDVYQYYKEINDQLEAKNRIFDPVSFQVRGNITSDNDPEEPVLGVFEVASTSMRTYSFSDFLANKTIKFEEIESLDIEDLPPTGILYFKYPSFWIFDH